MYEKRIALLNTAIADEIAAIHQYMYFHFRVKPARAKPGGSDGRVGGGWPRRRTASAISGRKPRPRTATANSVSHPRPQTATVDSNGRKPSATYRQ